LDIRRAQDLLYLVVKFFALDEHLSVYLLDLQAVVGLCHAVDRSLHLHLLQLVAHFVSLTSASDRSAVLTLDRPSRLQTARMSFSVEALY
jgi:hypothetical protein